MITELQYLITVQSTLVVTRRKYISGPMGLHHSSVLMLRTAICMIIRANTIDCYPSEINFRLIIETLHRYYAVSPKNESKLSSSSNMSLYCFYYSLKFYKCCSVGCISMFEIKLVNHKPCRVISFHILLDKSMIMQKFLICFLINVCL